MPRVLVYRAGGGLGDAVCCLSAVTAVCKQYGPENVELGLDLSYLPLFRHLHASKTRNLLRATHAELTALTKVKSPHRGVLFPGIDLFFNLRGPERIHEHETEDVPYLSRIECFCDACGVTPKSYTPHLPISDEQKHEARTVLRLHSGERGLIGLQWRARDPYKSWPKVAEFCAAAKEAGYCVAAFGVDGSLKDAQVNVVEKPIMQVAALLAECDVLVAPDSGLLHLAAAVKCPTVALFGPTDGAVTCKHYPYAKGHIIRHPEVAGDVGCKMPCLKRQPRGYHCPPGKSRCMDAITVKEVLAEVGSIVDRKST